MINKIVSGGQTGADQAALDVAINHNIPHGGWIPKERLTEDGALPAKYHLQEMDSDSYSKRTEQNVMDSDGTVIISHGHLTGGSALTMKFAEKHCKPNIHLNMENMSFPYAARMLKTWISDNGIKILNVAGPRASGDPEIYDTVTRVLEAALIAGKSAK
ncbi:MAG: putative molybdenum carrier protein [Desulfobulbaceae bacterium]|nr:putative molybdenum carrier protein [Desulfobulbaceae bacterium]